MMQRLRRLLGWPARLLAKPAEELTRAERTLSFTWRLSRHCARQLRKDRAGQMAAALTYHTLFSLLPTLVLMLVVARVFVGEAQLEQFKQTIVDFALSGVTVQETTQDATPPPAAPAASRASIATAPPAEAPPAQAPSPTEGVGDEGVEGDNVALTRDQYDQARRRLEADVQGWLDKLEAINFRSIGVVGVLLFVWGATGLLATIEKSFNQIYGGSQNRPWYFRVLMYYSTLTLAPVIIVAGQVLQQRALGAIDSIGWLGPVASIAVVLSPLATIWVVLVAMYVLLPNTRVDRGAAALGALLSSILWVALVTGFRLYTTEAATGSLYGALALLPITLLWLWLTWLIVLFGLEAAYALQTLPDRGLAEQQRLSEEERLFDARAVVPIMATVGEGFAHGEAPTPAEVAKRLGLSDRLVARVMDQMHDEKLLHRVLDPGTSPPRFTLAMPPGQITVRRLLETGSRLTVSRLTAGAVPGASMLRKLSEAVDGAAADTTLAHVIEAEADGAATAGPTPRDEAKAASD